MWKMVTNQEVSELMRTMGQDMVDHGAWEYVPGKQLVIVEYDSTQTDIVQNFLGQSMMNSMLVRAFDVYELADTLNVAFGEVLKKVVSFVTAEMLSEEMNLIIGVDRQCNGGNVNFTEHMAIVAAQFKASVTVIKMKDEEVEG